MVTQADEDIDLAAAALYICGEEYPDLDVDWYLNVLDALGRDAGNHIGDGLDLRTKVEALSDFLCVQQGFRGGSEEYYDPRNSYLNDVLNRRVGIPITLSLVYMEVARRLGVVFEGIGLPGHFIIRTGPLDQELYVDPFNGGEIMSRSDCERAVHDLFQGRIQFKEEFLRPYTKKDILIRILANLKQNYVRKEDYDRAVSAADITYMIAPSLGTNLKDRALCHYALKHYKLAIKDFEAYIKIAPDAEDAKDVKRQIRSIRKILLSLN